MHTGWNRKCWIRGPSLPPVRYSSGDYLWSDIQERQIGRVKRDAERQGVGREATLVSFEQICGLDFAQPSSIAVLVSRPGWARLPPRARIPGLRVVGRMLDADP